MIPVVTVLTNTNPQAEHIMLAHANSKSSTMDKSAFADFFLDAPISLGDDQAPRSTQNDLLDTLYLSSLQGGQNGGALSDTVIESANSKVIRDTSPNRIYPLPKGMSREYEGVTATFDKDHEIEFPAQNMKTRRSEGFGSSVKPHTTVATPEAAKAQTIPFQLNQLEHYPKKASLIETVLPEKSIDKIRIFTTEPSILSSKISLVNRHSDSSKSGKNELLNQDIKIHGPVKAISFGGSLDVDHKASIAKNAPGSDEENYQRIHSAVEQQDGRKSKIKSTKPTTVLGNVGNLQDTDQISRKEKAPQDRVPSNTHIQEAASRLFTKKSMTLEKDAVGFAVRENSSTVIVGEKVQNVVDPHQKKPVMSMPTIGSEEISQQANSILTSTSNATFLQYSNAILQRKMETLEPLSLLSGKKLDSNAMQEGASNKMTLEAMQNSSPKILPKAANFFEFRSLLDESVRAPKTVSVDVNAENEVYGIKFKSERLEALDLLARHQVVLDSDLKRVGVNDFDVSFQRHRQECNSDRPNSGPTITQVSGPEAEHEPGLEALSLGDGLDIRF